MCASQSRIRGTSAPRQRGAMRSRRLFLWMACLGTVAATAVATATAQRLSAVTAKPDLKVEVESLLGSYLAGRYAREQRDTSAAAEFYSRALARDPDNEVLIEQTFLMEATEGNWPRAIELAQAIAERHDSHRMAQLVLGLSAFKSGNFAGAEEHFRAAGSGPIGELTSTLARAWVKLAIGDVRSEQTFLMEATEGNWPRAIELAQAIAERHDSHRMAQLVLGLSAFKSGNFAGAEEHFRAAGSGPIGELTSTLARAWVKLAIGDVRSEQTFLMEATEGNWPRAIELAQAIAERHDSHRMAQLVLGLSAFKSGNFAGAEEHFRAAGSGPIGELTSTLARAWVKLAIGDV